MRQPRTLPAIAHRGTNENGSVFGTLKECHEGHSRSDEGTENAPYPPLRIQMRRNSSPTRGLSLVT